MRILTRIITRFLFYVGFCVVSCLSQGCQNYTWIQVPQAKSTNNFIMNGINSQSACQSACINLATCYGVAWDGTNCYLNNASSSQLVYNVVSQPNLTYFSLIRNYPSCAGSGCFYSWNGQNHIHGFSGATNGKTDVNECIKSCQDDPSCTAVDFDYTNNPPSCWIIKNTIAPGPSETVYHFNKDCTTQNTQTTLTGTGAATLPATTLPGQAQTPVAGQSTSTLTASISSSTVTKLNQSFSTTASASNSTTTTLVAATSSTKSNQSITTPNQSHNQTSVSVNMPLVNSTTSTRQPAGSCGVETCNDLQVCGSDKKCTCDFNCPNTGSEAVICGADGNYYNNLCLLLQYSCKTNMPIGEVDKSICDQNNSTGTDGGACNCLAIKPAYIVLIGVGGGCLLLVLTAIIILCQYPMNASRSRDGGTPIYGTGNGDGGVCYTQEIVMEEGQITVEDNPYYNKSDISSPPDFTKEENIM